MPAVRAIVVEQLQIVISGLQVEVEWWKPQQKPLLQLLVILSLERIWARRIFLWAGAKMVEFLTLFVLFYIWHMLGVTVGLHRLLAHRTFACPKPVEYFLVLSGYLAFEGSPTWWATIHRAHHRHDDTALDPHSPRYGLFNALVGWLMKPGYESHIDPNVQAKDLINDPVYRFLEQGGSWHRAHLLATAICLGFRVVLFFLFGWIPALASLLAGFAVFQVPLMLNVLCHIPKLGYKTFATKDDSVNVWWVAVLALGEGWHNNHHASPGSAKSGFKRHEIDPSWLVILLMKKLGLVSRVNVPPQMVSTGS